MIDMKESAIIKNKNASKIQALFRGNKFRSKELPNIVTKDLVNKKNKKIAATRIQNAIRNKNAIRKVAATRANNIVEEEKNKEKQIQQQQLQNKMQTIKPNSDLDPLSIFKILKSRETLTGAVKMIRAKNIAKQYRENPPKKILIPNLPPLSIRQPPPPPPPPIGMRPPPPPPPPPIGMRPPPPPPPLQQKKQDKQSSGGGMSAVMDELKARSEAVARGEKYIPSKITKIQPEINVIKPKKTKVNTSNKTGNYMDE